jgi:5-methyltetrahydropteroyltriglutamate--homocysteine methyltransferase
VGRPRQKKSNGEKLMAPSTPPFRADHVGSLLRPKRLAEARAMRQANKMEAKQFREIEEDEIRKAIAKQEEIGLRVVTDGEFPRSWWHFDFNAALTGAELYDTGTGIQFKGVQTRSEGVRIVDKLDFPADHPFIAQFKFIAANTRVTPKITIPAPPVLHFRSGRTAVSKSAYPDMDAFFSDLGKAYRKAVKAFYDAGCRYLQMDDTVWAYLCSPEQLERAKERGEDVARLPQIYADVINYAIAEKPADMTISTHVCRGNFRSTWVSSGGYEPVAEILFGFESLRFLPKGKKRVVLGLVTSKSGTLEKPEDVKRRIDEAAKYAALDQLCLSPQCGFASTEEGNVLAEDEQWAKLAMVVKIAAEVWGKN